MSAGFRLKPSFCWSCQLKSDLCWSLLLKFRNLQIGLIFSVFSRCLLVFPVAFRGFAGETRLHLGGPSHLSGSRCLGGKAGLAAGTAQCCLAGTWGMGEWWGTMPALFLGRNEWRNYTLGWSYQESLDNWVSQFCRVWRVWPTTDSNFNGENEIVNDETLFCQMGILNIIVWCRDKIPYIWVMSWMESSATAWGWLFLWRQKW